MLYRTCSAFIVVFWLVMAGLLIRQQIGEGGQALREVPVAHVVKLLLMHEQTSDLTIFSEKRRLGQLRIHPRMRGDGHSRVIEFSGNLLTNLPGAERQRMVWEGEWVLEKTLATRRFAIGLTLREHTGGATGAYRSRITITPSANPAENVLRFTLHNDLRQLDARTYTLDEKGLQTALQEILDPSVLQMLQGQKRTMSPPVIKALQSTMLIHGEHLDTYLLTIEQSGQTLLEADVSQLGQILRAKTLIGYTLRPDDLLP